MQNKIEIYDTTLRDGSQLEGISLTVDDKLRIIKTLDDLGVDYIEAGWPGANPKDDELFQILKSHPKLAQDKLKYSKLVAFGSTRRANVKAEDDPVLQNLIKAQTDVVCIVAKTSQFHVEEALKTTLDEALAMIYDSVKYLCENNKQVLVDCEHFFDGFISNKEFSFKALESAINAGASHIVLCDTNGGTLPHVVFSIVSEVVEKFPNTVVSIHTHDDSGVAVANSLEAVRAGARQIQGTINGYGERTGNCNLLSVIPALSIKQNYLTIPTQNIKSITKTALKVSDIVNITLNPQTPYVGVSAFAHKAGLHTSAIARNKKAYEHIDPSEIGNETRLVVSELAGKSTLILKAKEFGIDLDDNSIISLINKLKELEFLGYHFEAAGASLYLLMKQSLGWEQSFFKTKSFRVSVDDFDANVAQFNISNTLLTQATVKLEINNEEYISTSEGNGPVNSLDAALRKSLVKHFPKLEKIKLSDYKVRILNSSKGTAAKTRVLLDSTNGSQKWSTIGVSENIIEASWQALTDSIIYGLLQD